MRCNIHERFVHLLIDMGELLLASGAEVNRVEDTLSRMGEAYGAEETSVFVITSCMIVTMRLPDGVVITQTRREGTASSTDFSRLEDLNALSRQYCANLLSLSELEETICSMKNVHPRRWKCLVGSVLVAGSFAMFFGGDLLDGIVASLSAILVCLVQRVSARICTNRVIYQLLCALLVGIAINCIGMVIPGLNLDKIIIGNIMLLVPGIAMTNSVRDILVDDTISGVMRFVESVLWAGALASGFMVSMWMFGRC